LSFLLSMTTNVDSLAAAPDLFAFSILDAGFMPIPTLDSSFADALVTITIDSLTPSFAAYASDPDRTNIRLPTPDVTPVPEPGTLALLGVGAAAALIRRRRGTGVN
jgi:hypothetical protein